MGKKRKAGGSRTSGKAPENSVVNARTKYGINETFDDSEDEFHTGREKILLEERPSVKRRRRIDEENEFLEPSDEEVLGYDVPSDEEIDQDDDESDAQDDVQSDISRREDDKEEEELGNFGRSKEDYYNTDQAQTEEDALAEEREARRIQQKQLESMTEADFGFDEGQWIEQEDEDAKGQRTVTEKLPELKIPEDMPVEERLKVLKGRYPEFEPLARDFLDLQPLHDELKLAAGAAEAITNTRKRKVDAMDGQVSAVPVAVTKYQALSAYLGVIGMYFALLTSSALEKSKLPMAPSELRDHAVIRSLVQCRQLWESLRDVPLPSIEDTASLEEFGDLVEAPTTTAVEAKAQPAKKQKKRKSKAERAAFAAAQADAAARQDRLEATEASLADLDKLVSARQPKSASVAPAHDDISDFGDEVPLTVEEAAAKAQRKKSLRFYTSQIAQKANKRGAASRDAGGDTDLPYKERLKDRQARLNLQAEKRGNAGADLDDNFSAQSDEEPSNLERENGSHPSSEDYYQQISNATSLKRSNRAALSAASQLAASQNAHLTNITETVGTDGKRGISYEIRKNKGLIPHRKKDVRNPRVKKRKKFDEKLKKLRGSGQRQVYKGGEGRGGYGGETTGINRGVVRSVKL